MAIYNRWAYRQLYAKLNEHISDENYRADSGLFFRSIHGTLVHLLLSSKIWYARLTSSLSHPIQISFQNDENPSWRKDRIFH